MRVEVWVPTRGDVWYETAGRLLEAPSLAFDMDMLLQVFFCRNVVSVVDARNRIAHDFLSGDADVLVMLDDDVVPSPDWLELVQGLGPEYDVLGAPCPVMRPGLPVLPNVYRHRDGQTSIDLARALGSDGCLEVDAVGFGLVAISRPVMEKLKVFKTKQVDGRIVVGEDIEFCLRARSQGFSVGVDMRYPCEHLLRLHGNEVAYTYSQLMENLMRGAADAEAEDGGGAAEPAVRADGADEAGGAAAFVGDEAVAGTGEVDGGNEGSAREVPHGAP